MNHSAHIVHGPWMASDIRRLREEYPERGASAFPDRSNACVHSQAKRCGVKFNPSCKSSHPVIIRLHKERKRRNLSIQAVAKYVNKSHTSISNWENGIAFPGLSDLTDWLDFFDLELVVKKKQNPWEYGK